MAAVLDAGRACSPPGTTCPTSGRAAAVKAFFALMLVLETFMVGVFAATDVFLFYVFFEAMLIPVYFLIGALRRRRAGSTPR